MTIAALHQRISRSPAIGSLVFWCMASLPVMLLVLLFVALFTLSPALADTMTCAGKNVLDEMAKTDPAGLARVRQEAAAIPNGKGILWRIEKDGVPASYLMGTMHLTDPRVLGMPKGAAAAFADARTVIIESDEILDEKKAAVALLAKPELTMFTDDTTITKLLDSRENEKLERGLKSRGISLALVQKMRPWIIASFVSLPACEMARKAEGRSFLDKQLALDAVAQGKQLKGLETMMEQLQAMAELPIKLHLKALVETLELGSRMEDIMTTMVDLYVSGDIGTIVPMLNAATTRNGSPESDYAAFEQRIVIDRNHVMADRAAPFLDKGSVFMAVGALHLPGKEGVIELLRGRGFRLTAIN